MSREARVCVVFTDIKFSFPLAGKVSRGAWRMGASSRKLQNSTADTPTPNPAPQGGGESRLSALLAPADRGLHFEEFLEAEVTAFAAEA